MNDCLRNSTLLSWVAGNDVLLLARVYEKVLDAGEPPETSATTAWSLYLSIGYAGSIPKASGAGRVRPVSAFIA